MYAPPLDERDDHDPVEAPDRAHRLQAKTSGGVIDPPLVFACAFSQGLGIFADLVGPVIGRLRG